MSTRYGLWRTGAPVCVALLLILALTASGFAAARVLQNSTPGIVQTGKNLGPENPAAVIEVTVRLQQHNLAAREDLVKQMYTPGTAQYHKFLTTQEYNARFAPTAQEATVVKNSSSRTVLALFPLIPTTSTSRPEERLPRCRERSTLPSIASRRTEPPHLPTPLTLRSWDLRPRSFRMCRDCIRWP